MMKFLTYVGNGISTLIQVLVGLTVVGAVLFGGMQVSKMANESQMAARASNWVDPIEHIRDCAVTVGTPTGYGSGTLFNYQGESYVLTASHVLDQVPTPLGPIFMPTSVTKEEFKDGLRHSVITVTGNVLVADPELDIAILKLDQTTFPRVGIEFADNTPPKVGTEVYHVGSMGGPANSMSLQRGIVSYTDRLNGGKPFDQCDFICYPGSSGGGVYDKDGHFLGILTRTSKPGISLMVPTRMIRAWAECMDLKWVVND